MFRKRLISCFISIALITQLFAPIAQAEQIYYDENNQASSISQQNIVEDGNSENAGSIDINNLSPEEYDLWKKNYIMQNVTTPASMQINLDQLSNNKAYNDYLEYVVNDNGRFTIGTTGGNPDSVNDDNKIMLYGHPYPRTSYTTIRLDEKSYIYTPTTLPSFDSENSNVSEYTIGDMNIKQILSIVNNTSTNREDTVQVKYEITNNGFEKHDTGVRIMFDTMLGNNDAAPFRIPGIGPVTTELELSGENIPEYWQAFDSLTNPSVVSQGTILSNNDNMPDKVQFTNWRNVYNIDWGYVVRPNNRNGDSAVSIIWEQSSVGPGETKEYVTYYGISDFTQDLRPPLAVSVSGATSIEVNDKGYVPNPFTITAYVYNSGNGIADNVKAKLILPEGLSLLNDQNEVNLGSLQPSGQDKQASWKVYIDPSEQERHLTYYVSVTADGIDSKMVGRDISIPPLDSEAFDEMLSKAGDDDINEGTSCAVGDPINMATGNFLTSKGDITVEGYNPIIFSRFYNSIDKWQGDLGVNWHHNYEFRLTKTSDQRIKIAFDDGHLEVFNPNDDGSYSPMPGKKDKLQVVGNDGYELTLFDKTKYFFSTDGNLVYIKDIKGNCIELSYDNGKLVKVGNECGYLVFEYEGNLIKRIADSAGRFVEYVYTDGKLTSFKDVEGNTSNYKYDEKNRLSQIIDPLQNVKIFNLYDEKGRTIEQSMADGTHNSISYDDNNMTTTFTQGNGVQIIYKHDSNYRIYERVYINGTERLTFNDKNQVTAFTDKKGYTYLYEYDSNGNISKETDAAGNAIEYTYDDNNKITSIKNPDGSIYSYTYDEKGNMLSAKDPLEREFKMEYNEKGFPSKVIQANGSCSSMEYDDKGNPISVIDTMGNVTTFKYDSLNRVIEIIRPEGNKVEYEYTTSGKIRKIINSDGTSTSAVYDSRGLLAESTDEEGNKTSYLYNNMGKLKEVVDAAGGVTRYEYDNMYNIKSVTKPDGSTIQYNYNDANQLILVTDEESNTTKYEYDANGNLVKEISPKGEINQNEYDALNRLVQTVNANNSLTKYEYRYDGKLQKVIDALNGTTEHSYDAAGQLLNTKDPLGNITSYAYNPLGKIETITDAKGAVTKYEYNLAGNVSKITKADGTTESYDYDKNGNVVKFTDAKGNITSYNYDSRERLIAIKNANGAMKAIEYTANGKISSMTDENGNKTNYKYDSLGRLVELTDAKGGKTNYVYDAVGNLTEVHKFAGITKETADSMNLTDGQCTEYEPQIEEQITGYKYDKRGLLLEERSPQGRITIYTYDQNGNLISKKDGEGYVTNYEYDAVENLKRITYNNGKQVEFDYNPLNQITAMRDWLGTTFYELDACGRILKVKDYENRITEYTWGPTGEKQSIKYPDGSTVNYEYDALGRLAKVKDYNEKLTNYTYDETGNIVEKLLPNGFKTQYTYDNLSRLVRLTNYDNQGKVADDFKYSYDAVGNRIQIDREKYKFNIADKYDEVEGTTQYKYDQLNQLVEVSKPNQTVEKFFYDAAGNRIRKENWNLGYFANASDYKYDIENKLVEVKGNGIQLYGKSTFSCNMQMEYDNRGNLVKIKNNDKVLNEYTFDDTNSLTSAVNRYEITTDFTYDGAGRRVKKTVTLPEINIHGVKPNNIGESMPQLDGEYDIDGRGIWDKEIYSLLFDENKGKEGVIEYNYIVDATSPYNDVLMVYGREVKTQRYVYGNDVICFDSWNDSMEKWNLEGLEALPSEPDRIYYLQDELGSPIRLVGENGATRAVFSYDAFGRPILPTYISGDVRYKENIFSFTGYQNDITTDLMYAQARYYMPILGRFTAMDNYKGSIYEPITLNPYQYCGNNPLVYVDEDGNMSLRQAAIKFLPGVISSVLGISDIVDNIKSLINWNTYKGLYEFGKALISGKIGILDIVEGIGNSIIEPYKYLFEHSKNVFTGSPCDNEVYEYGKQMGNVIKTILGLFGVGISIAPAFSKLLKKVAPKFKAWLDKTADTVKSVFKKGSNLDDADAEVAADIIEGGLKADFGKKLEYVFGNATGTKHNIDRSIAMEKQLNSIGIFDNKAGRELVQDNLTKALNDPSSILKVQDNGRIVRESLLSGPNGLVKVESIWEDAKLITVQIFGGK